MSMTVTGGRKTPMLFRLKARLVQHLFLCQCVCMDQCVHFGHLVSPIYILILLLYVLFRLGRIMWAEYIVLALSRCTRTNGEVETSDETRTGYGVGEA
jgi:hypothetical protein